MVYGVDKVEEQQASEQAEEKSTHKQLSAAAVCRCIVSQKL